MKQILIVTRIDRDQRNDEFVELFPDAESPISGKDKELDLQLSIHNGIRFYNKNKQIADSIKAQINAEATEVLIVLHYTGSFAGLRNALNDVSNGQNWQIQQYSSGNKNYDEIKKAFRNLQTDSSKVEPIYKLFSPDHLLQAKLELLHNCIVPENIPAEEDLDNLLLEHSDLFKSFKERVGKIKENIEKENVEENKTKELTWNDKDYIEALRELRISLLGS